MTANPPIPAIANAVTDAIGVQICDLPITPEKVLRAWFQGGRVVLKVFSPIKRQEDLPLDEFREWVFERHAPMGKQLPGLREYHVSVVERNDPDLPYCAVAELSASTTRTRSRGVRERGRAEQRAVTCCALPSEARAAAHMESASSGPRTSDRVGRIGTVIFTTKAEYGVRLLIQLGLRGGDAGLTEGGGRCRGLRWRTWSGSPRC